MNQVLILLPLRSERKTNCLAQAAGPVYKCPLTTGNHPTNAVARKHGLGIVTVGQQVVKAVLEKKTSQMKKPELPRSLRILAHIKAHLSLGQRAVFPPVQKTTLKT